MALRDLASAADTGTAVARSRITVSQFLTEWLETIKPRVRAATWVSYRIAVDRITRQIGAAQLQSLTALQVEALYTTLLERGGSGGRPLAPKTVRNCHIVLRRALADAERLGLVSRNPAAAAKAVSAARPEPKTWSSEEIQRFFEAVAGERLSMAFVLLATTGMRRGEVLGLRWEDVDVDARALSIVQTLTTVSNRIHLGPPKTGKSRRRVSLDAVTFDALKAHRTRQLEERLAAGDLWSTIRVVPSRRETSWTGCRRRCSPRWSLCSTPWPRRRRPPSPVAASGRPCTARCQGSTKSGCRAVA